MTHENVYYINVKPYVHNLPFEEMLSRFEHSEIGAKILSTTYLKTNFATTMMIHFKRYAYDYIKKNEDEYEVDKIITKKIMIHLQTFFKTTPDNGSCKKKSQKNFKNAKLIIEQKIKAIKNKNIFHLYI